MLCMHEVIGSIPIISISMFIIKNKKIKKQKQRK